MDMIRGERAGSKGHRPMRTDITSPNTTAYEAIITSLFVPWIIDNIPEGSWQKLQEKLGYIIRGIISGKERV
jgi:hypothetical protein